MHGDNVRKAIKGTEARNNIIEGVNKVHATAWYNQEGKTFPKEKDMKTNKDTKYVKKSGAKPGNEVKNQVEKVKDKNTITRGANDYFAGTEGVRKWDQGKRAFDDGTKNSKSTAPKYKAEAGSGSIPSGTNTNVPGMMGRKKRKDGSYGC